MLLPLPPIKLGRIFDGRPHGYSKPATTLAHRLTANVGQTCRTTTSEHVANERRAEEVEEVYTLVYRSE